MKNLTEASKYKSCKHFDKYLDISLTLGRAAVQLAPKIHTSVQIWWKMKTFNKILIANRGEIAIRIMRAANEMGKKTVAVFAEEDKLGLHRFKADEA